MRKLLASLMLLNELIWSAIVPLVVAATVMTLADWSRVRPRAAWALSVGLAYVATCIALTVRTTGLSTGIAKHVRPLEAHDWLSLAVLAAMGVTLLATAAPRAWQRWIVGLSALMCVAVPLRLVAGHLAGQWSATLKLTILTLLAASLAIAWLLLSTARDDEQPRLRAILLIIVTAAMAAMLGKSASFVIGQGCVIIAAALAGASLVSSRQNSFIGLAGAAGVLTMSLGGLLIVAHFYAALSATDAVLLAVSLVAAGGRLPGPLAGPSWRQTLLRAALCLAPLGIAVLRAF